MHLRLRCCLPAGWGGTEAVCLKPAWGQEGRRP
jgi:hypothetical protein